MMNKKDNKQVNATKRWTKVFVWVMLFSMAAPAFISLILRVLGS